MVQTERASTPDLLGDYWDALVMEDGDAPPSPLDPALVKTLHDVVRRDDARAPDPAFVSALERRLLGDMALLTLAVGSNRVAAHSGEAWPGLPNPVNGPMATLCGHGAAEMAGGKPVLAVVPVHLGASDSPVVQLSGRPRSTSRAVATALGLAALLIITLGAVAAMSLLHQRPVSRGTGPANIPALQFNPVQFLWESRGLPTLSTTRGGLDVVFPMTDPYHFAIDARGNLWVPDTWNKQFRILAPDGSLLEIWGQKGAEAGEFNFVNVQAFNENGIGAAVFDAPGNLYVADAGNFRIQVFAPDRQFIRAWGSKGEGDGQFIGLKDLAIGADGDVYALDASRNVIQVFGQDGEFLRSWGADGVGEGEFLSPHGIAIDPSGNVIVADTGNHRLQKFTPHGEFLAAWGQMGTGDVMFRQPDDVAIDAQGRMYVTDTSNNRVEILDANGTFLAAWGTRGSKPGQIIAPTGIALDHAGNIYVSEGGNERIQKFRLLPPLG